MTAPQSGHSIRVEPNRSRVTVRVAGRPVAETTQGLVLRETGHRPVQYLPRGDVESTLLERSDLVTHCPFKGDATHFHLRIGERKVENGAWSYESPSAGVGEIKDHIAFYPEKVDAIDERPAE